jgi:hypothetical protein
MKTGRRRICCGFFILALSSVASVWADEPLQPEIETRGLAPIPQKSLPNAAKPMQEPNWPQQFDVRGPETDSFGFAVTQPGPIIIDVQSQGPPITVTLRGPGLPPHMERGAGSVRLTHQVAAQDVARGMFWGLSIGLQQPGPTQAIGQVTVQHPPADPAKVQAAAAAQQQSAQQQVAQRQAEMQQVGAQAAAQMEAAFQQRKAQFDQQRHQRHAALMAQAQPMIDRLRMRGPGQIRPRGIEGEDAATAEAKTEESAEVETRGLSRTRPTAPISQASMGASPLTKMPQLQGTTAPLIIQGPGAGSPNPVITSLSVAQGQPGDPVMINGSGFDDAGGEVHFVLSPGKDLIAPPGVVWRNDQIFATVPEVAGVLGFNGTVYVQRTADKQISNLVGFRFEPATELREFQLSEPFYDSVMKIPPRWRSSSSFSYRVTYENDNIFWGFKETDEYFVTTRLKNGWVLDEVFFQSGTCQGGCNYLLEKHIGSDRPYFSVRYWLDAGVLHTTSYHIRRITIRGPKGLPDGLVVP